MAITRIRKKSLKGHKKIRKEQIVDARNVLIELSVVPLGSNVQNGDPIESVLSIVDKAGLFHERTHNGTCIEEKWSDINPLIYACYERLHAQTPQGFLKVSIQ